MAVEDFLNGANILQKVDVSQIFKSLAMGIAEAQQELDDNSISQLQRLSETELAGKSLLELGFVPAFYSFTYADISASIHLRMAEKTSLELGVKANFDYSSANASESDFSEMLNEHQFFSEKGEFKSNRKFSMKSSSKKQVKVNNQYYKLDENEKVVSRIEKLHKELLQDEKIERVNMQQSNSYYTVYENMANYSVIVLPDLTTGSITAASASVTLSLSSTFTSVFTTIGATYGLFGSDLFGLSTSPIKMDLYFDNDKSRIDFAYDYNLKGIQYKDKAFEALAAVLKNDPSLQITIEGSCDRTAGSSYNDGLSTRRCESMRRWLVAKGASNSQIHIAPKGETLATANGDADNSSNPDFRRVRITLAPNRYWFFFATAVVVSGTGTVTGSVFVQVLTPSPALVVVNGSSAGFVAGTNVSTYESLNAGSSTSLYESETIDDIHYFLHKDTEITFMAYSNNSEEINIVAEEGSQSEVKVYSNENSQERIKNLATKNKSNKTFAAGASVDFRFSRQFEMSVEGSATMSAHMVAVPPPEAFTTFIASEFNPAP